MVSAGVLNTRCRFSSTNSTSELDSPRPRPILAETSIVPIEIPSAAQENRRSGIPNLCRRTGHSFSNVQLPTPLGNREHHLPEVFAGFDHPMGLGGLFQGQHPVHDRPDLAALEGRRKLFH